MNDLFSAALFAILLVGFMMLAVSLGACFDGLIEVCK